MPVEIGRIESIFRYPVKSMAGERLDVATLGCPGLEGDRRLALRRLDNRGGMPWLTAGRLHHLVLFAPQRQDKEAQGDLPMHVRAPDDETLPVFSEELVAEVGCRHGAPVQMMQLNHGIFDDASISLSAGWAPPFGGRPGPDTPNPNTIIR
jgi:uncharacterized protein YcbX